MGRPKNIKIVAMTNIKRFESGNSIYHASGDELSLPENEAMKIILAGGAKYYKAKDAQADADKTILNERKNLRPRIPSTMHDKADDDPSASI